MKKLLNFILVILSCFLFTACTNLDAPKYVKTEFKLNENASIDYYDITMIKSIASKQYNGSASVNGQYIILTFKIKNNDKNNQNINSNNFYLRKDNQEYLANVIHPRTIKANETTEYIVIFDVPIDSNYDILFYSGVVTNNIEFNVNL